MNLNRKKIIWIALGLAALYFGKKYVEKRAVAKYEQSILQSSGSKTNERIEQIKLKVFELLERVHYKYKTDRMSDEDIKSYERIVNHVVS